MEIAPLFCGIYGLFTGKLPPSFGKEVKVVLRVWPARLCSLICLLPIPLSFVAVMVAARLMAAEGKDIGDPANRWVATAIEFGDVVACGLVVAGVRTRNGPIGARPASRSGTDRSDPLS
jgi:hypothetical protein